jgi:outer membrane receptor protein involved in Fe transport
LTGLPVAAETRYRDNWIQGITMRNTMLRGGAAALLGATVMLAIAPQWVAAQAEADAATPGLEEVVVTARKREESLQDVPLSVSALTSSKIEELRILSPDDIARFTPGFSFVSSFGRLNGDRPVVRGQSNILGAANAAFFVDGVYVSGPSVSTETSNLERIEVIKGPQAALYGRGTYAGAINYITKKPTNELTAKLSATVAQHDETELSGFASGPIVADRLFFYAGARVWEYGGEYVNQIDGQKAGALSTDSFTAKLLWTPTESLEVTLLGTYSRDDDNGAFALGLQGQQFNSCQLRVIAGNAANNFTGSQFPRSPGYYCGTVFGADRLQVAQRTDLMTDPGLQRVNKRGALAAKYTFGGGYELSSITGYHDENQESQIDVSYAGYDAFIAFAASQSGAFWRRGEESRDDFSQELRLRSPSEDRFRWLAGVYYFRANDDLTRDDKFLPVGSALGMGPGCVQLSPTSTTCPNGQGTLFEREIRNKAVFAGLEYDFTDRLTATVEARYAKEDQEQKNIFVLAPFCNPMQVLANGTIFDNCTFSGEFKSTTPRVTLRYKATPDQTYYLNWAKGNKPGGFNTGTAVNAGLTASPPVNVRPVYDEEESKAWELGAKWLLLENRLRLNAALFYTQLTGQQLTSNVAGVVNGNTVLNSYIDNIGETEIKGVEIDAEAVLSDRWDIRGTFSYVDSKIQSFFDNNQAALYSPVGQFRPTQSAFTVTVLCNAPGQTVPGRPACRDALEADIRQYGDAAGKVAPRVPKVQASLIANYSAPIGEDRTFRFSTDVTYEGSKYAQVDNLAETGAHTYVGARLGIESERWTLTLWGKNLFDDDTSIDILRYIDNRALNPATLFTTGGGTAGIGRVGARSPPSPRSARSPRSRSGPRLRGAPLRSSPEPRLRCSRRSSRVPSER